MIKYVIKKELQDIIQSQKFVWAFIVTSFLIIVTFYIGGNNYHLQQRQHEAALSENIRQMGGITDWAQIKHHIFLPPDPLYTLINGIDNDIGDLCTPFLGPATRPQKKTSPYEKRISTKWELPGAYHRCLSGDYDDDHKISK